jgi:hypothetical protein
MAGHDPNRRTHLKAALQIFEHRLDQLQTIVKEIDAFNRDREPDAHAFLDANLQKDIVVFTVCAQGTRELLEETEEQSTLWETVHRAHN